jgi:hypothetical protein
VRRTGQPSHGLHLDATPQGGDGPGPADDLDAQPGLVRRIRKPTHSPARFTDTATQCGGGGAQVLRESRGV